MRLKSIKLAGFKSFVDATTVPFSTNMTAIVGPNGCGKSNIIDAVRWVMGESSAKNLRGESMTDVIFNGSSGRQPIGQASIELLFENQEGKLVGELAGFTEISIKRKVTREGVSQYYLNGTKCRRRDVTDIFLGTGMGPRSYAIIEQGMITRLIESKPEELRVYLEEAAGISKYKERRRETENRMRRTQDNLDRLADIRDELGKQLQHLKRQANAAERYAEYKQEERLLSAKLHYVYWHMLDQDLSGKSSLCEQYEQEIENAVIAKNTNENKIDLYRTGVEEKQEIFNKFQAKYYQSGAEIASIEQQLKFQKARLQEQEQQTLRLNEEVEEIAEVLALDMETIELVNEELEAVDIVFEELNEQLEEGTIALEEREQAMTVLQQSWDQFNRESSDEQRRAEIEQSKILQTETKLRELELRHERFSQTKLELRANLENLDLGQWEEDQCLLDEKMLLAQQELDDVLPKIERCQEELEAYSSEKSLLHEQIAEKKAVLASLNTLQSAALGNADEILSEQLQQLKLPKSTMLMNSLVVKEGWELAVQQALSVWIDAIVLDEQVGEPDWRLADSQLAHSINILHGMGEHSVAAVRPGSLAEFVSGADHLIPYLNSIMTVSGISQALKYRAQLKGGESCICPEGIWFGANWSRIYKPEEAQAGVIQRAKSICELGEIIPSLETALNKANDNYNEAKDALQSLRSELQLHEVKIKEATHDKTRLAALHGADQAKFDQYTIQIKRNDEELEELVVQLEQERLVLDESHELREELLASLEVFADKKNQLLESREVAQTQLDETRAALRQQQNALHQKQLEKQQKQSQSLSLKQTIDRLENELIRKRERIAELGSSLSPDNESIEELSLKLEGLLETRLHTEERLTQARAEVDAVSSQLREEEHARAKYDVAIQESRDRLSSMRMDTQALSINKKNLEERILEDGYSIDALSEQVNDNDSEKELKQQLDQLAARIQRLGSINLAAIEEYKVQGERKLHLDEQNDELVSALDTLVDAIKKIDKETRTRFKETYDQVNEGLQRLFPKIFGGGNAYLELTDDNLLETGVMIIARPPGKKNATIHLLSGGEKSLTAIALIFAIFELNPAPFCMLDEVDAPLDDANVGRFANMVKDMSKQVQFIYISHNKVSMEKADQLMGVTMHEPGVSRLVSVDIDEAAAMVEG